MATFNPLHVGHLAYLEAAKRTCDALWVIVNNDVQVDLKGSTKFMPQQDRFKLIEALRVVDRVFVSIDKDRSVCETLRMVARQAAPYGDVIFVNGGDATAENVPEVAVCNELGIEAIFGIVPQLRESSKILREAGVE